MLSCLIAISDRIGRGISVWNGPGGRLATGGLCAGKENATGAPIPDIEVMLFELELAQATRV